MGKKLPILSGDKVIKILNSFGFSVAGQKGSHVKLKKKTGAGELIVIVPKREEVKKGVLLNILQQADIEKSEFLAAV